MIFTLLYWSFICWLIFVIGYTFIEYTRKYTTIKAALAIEEYFFTGFIIMATISAYSSIFIPLNWVMLLLVVLTGLVLYWLNRIKIKQRLREVYTKYKALKMLEKSILLWVLFFLVTIASGEIWVYDTKLYHAQNIQWIQKYAVVPGLGSFQPQLGFNNLFFPVTALFTLDIADFYGTTDLLIYPFNGIIIAILFLKIGFYFRKALLDKHWWSACFYSLIFGFCLTLFPRGLNSPAPDYVCAALIIYTFLKLEKSNFKISKFHGLFFSGLIITAVVFKLSALLFGLLILPLIKSNYTLKKTLTITGLGLMIGLPFLIRNYYLSGYLIFPFPYIDLFNPEWKIPYEIVDFEKLVVKSWAKIPNSNPTKIEAMPFLTWFKTWWVAKDLIWRPILLANILIPFSIFIFLKKEKLTLALLQGIILMNLLFWFYNAPDPRFAFGFLFIGAAFGLCSFLLIRDVWKYLNSKLMLGLCFLFLLFSLNFHKLYIKDFVSDPITWVMPKGFPPTKLKERKTNFRYTMPIRPDLCNNSPLPCATRPLGYVILRDSTDMQKGFMLYQVEE